MVETSCGVMTGASNIGVNNVNEVNLTQPITCATSPINVTHDASDNTHTESQNENVYYGKKVLQWLQHNKMFHLMSKNQPQSLQLILLIVQLIMYKW